MWNMAPETNPTIHSRQSLDDETAASQNETINSTETHEEDQGEASADYETMDTDNAVSKPDELTADENSSKSCIAIINSPASTNLEGRPYEKSMTVLNQSPATDTRADDEAKDEMPSPRGDKCANCVLD